jgi:cohesin complex subunit SCC1
MLPDRITPYDNLELLPPPDPSWLASQIEDVTAAPLGRRGRASQRDINLQEDYNNSQFLSDNLTQPKDDDLGNMDDLDLELDFGMDLDEPRIADTTIEMGREAPEARPVGDDLFSQLDIEAPRKEQDEGQVSMGLDITFSETGEGVRIAGDDGDILMGGDDDMTYDIGEQSVHPAADAPARGLDSRARISESPLSDVDEEFAREVELEYSRHQTTGMYEPAEEEAEETIVAPQRHRKKKLLQPDEQTMLSSTHIKEQQMTRDNILKPQSFLSKDPYVLALLNMQKTGDFVQEVLLEKRSAAWAPELRGLLSITAARPSAAEARKRKRDSGIAVTEIGEEEQPASKSPRLELPEDDTLMPAGGDNLGNQSIAAEGTVLNIPGDDSMLMIHDDDHEAHPAESREGPTSPTAHFDDTVAPIVHPADSGPVSIATKHAVHILRDLFGPEAATSDNVRTNSSVVFQELLPERRTTKADATKMFFECLVLATKDAIKVEQPEGTLGGPIRIRGKRGLWGDWAEREAGGEMASQEMEQQQEERNQPESAVQNSAAVAVSA